MPNDNAVYEKSLRNTLVPAFLKHLLPRYKPTIRCTREEIISTDILTLNLRDGHCRGWSVGVLGGRKGGRDGEGS